MAEQSESVDEYRSSQSMTSYTTSKYFSEGKFSSEGKYSSEGGTSEVLCYRGTMEASNRKNRMYGSLHSLQFANPLPEECSIPEVQHRKCIRKCCWQSLRAFAESRILQLLMFIFTVFLLFGDDLRLLHFEKDADPIFNGITLFALLLFFTEIIFNSLAVADYFLSSFFFLDVASMMSLVLDLTFVWEYLVGYESFSMSAAVTQNRQDLDGTEGITEYGRASRSGRVGARVARILRILRLIRVVRIFKIMAKMHLYGLPVNRHAIDGREDLQSEQVWEADEDEKSDLTQAESKVGRKLSEKTTLSVIALVLVMLIMVPLLDTNLSSMTMSSLEYGADVVDQAWQDYQLNSSSIFPERKTMGEDVLSGWNLHENRRLEWEHQLLLYILYHSHFAKCPPEASDCAANSLLRLCYLAYVSPAAPSARAAKEAFDEMSVQLTVATAADRAQRQDITAWASTNPQYELGEIPDDVGERLAAPWADFCKESSHHSVYGVSLMKDVPCPWKTLRVQETSWYSSRARKVHGSSHGHFVFLFDTRERVAWDSIMSMLRTVFIVLVLLTGAMFFSKDADSLVLQPIERMISTVRIIRQDPLYAIRLGQVQYPVVKHIGKQQVQRANSKTTLETKILENTIIKLGSLLALGFGEAGTQIIGQNLNSADVMVDVRIPGMKIEAIYGYCNIKNFTELTEVLQGRTMVFVNHIAAIVHRIVDEYLGTPNMNVGEAFLLVWRMGAHKEHVRSKLADLSVMSFIQIIAAVSRHSELIKYSEHPALVAHRGGSYHVGLGFALHFGWAIEGAIGSEFKIDASYVSSHVTMAIRLEALTDQYGVTILMSEPLVRLCSRSFAVYLRAIDHVKLQGTTLATRLFTIDLDTANLFACRPLKLQQSRTFRERLQARHAREQLKKEKLAESFEVHELFDTDRYVSQIRSKLPLTFYQEFEKGLLNYEAGEWDVAVKVLTGTRYLRSGDSKEQALEDGPSTALISYMEAFQFKAPHSWPGYRELKDRMFDWTIPGELEHPETQPPREISASRLNSKRRSGNTSEDNEYSEALSQPQMVASTIHLKHHLQSLASRRPLGDVSATSYPTLLTCSPWRQFASMWEPN